MLIIKILYIYLFYTKTIYKLIIKIMTIHTTTLGNRTFYINRTKKGSLNYNSVNEKTNRTFHYSSSLTYYKALRKAK